MHIMKLSRIALVIAVLAALLVVAIASIARPTSPVSGGQGGKPADLVPLSAAAMHGSPLKTPYKPMLSSPVPGPIVGSTIQRDSAGNVRRLHGPVAMPGAADALSAATAFLM